MLYNGLQKWDVATDAADCFIEPPGGLEAYQPRLRYLLLDEHRLKHSRAEEVRNFAEAVFRLEAGCGEDDVFTVIRELAKMLRSPELNQLRRALNVWVKGLLKRHAPDSKIVEAIDGITDIFEDTDMAEAAYANWGDMYKNKGRLEGEAKLLTRQLSRRFGPLPKWAETRVCEAKSAQLEKWADAVLDASSLAEVLGTPGPS